MKIYTVQELKEIATLKDGILWIETDEDVRIKNGDVKVSVGIKSEKYVTLILDGNGKATVEGCGSVRVGRDVEVKGWERWLVRHFGIRRSIG